MLRTPHCRADAVRQAPIPGMPPTRPSQTRPPSYPPHIPHSTPCPAGSGLQCSGQTERPPPPGRCH
eukprot:350732-Chlamydomonas_euryale.AAC.2